MNSNQSLFGIVLCRSRFRQGLIPWQTVGFLIGLEFLTPR